MLVAGSGINGNNVIGSTDEGFISLPTDFNTGMPSGGGNIIATENVGVTLLKHGNVNPEKWLPGIQQVPALVRG